jgi:(2Fe-2S) ferredoxin
MHCDLKGRQVSLDVYSCFGQCQKGPNVLVREVLPEEKQLAATSITFAGRQAVLYHQVSPREVRQVIEQHVVGGQKINEFIERALDRSSKTRSK